jgi:hypothetical protein
MAVIYFINFLHFSMFSLVQASLIYFVAIFSIILFAILKQLNHKILAVVNFINL